MTTGPLKIWLDRNGTLLRLRMARPKANIVDAEMLGALRSILAEYADNEDLLAVLLDHDGPHFSFGASIAEHLPDQCADMIAEMHGTVADLVQFPLPILAVVGGQCLGGGLEVACSASLIFAGTDAMLGQPEVKVGVFAPAASCLLPELINQTHAEDLLYSGRSVTAEEARSMGLVAGVADDPEAAALEYFDEHLARLSAVVVRHAVRGAREDFAARIVAKLGKVEELYLSGLMKTRDAVEGLEAFMEKRPAKWENR